MKMKVSIQIFEPVTIENENTEKKSIIFQVFIVGEIGI